MCAACTVDLSTQLYLLTSCLILVAGANCDFVKIQEYGYEGSWLSAYKYLLPVLAFSIKRMCKSS